MHSTTDFIWQRHRLGVLLAAAALTTMLAGMALLPGCDRSRPPVPAHTCLIVGIGQDDPLWPIIKVGAQYYAGTTRSLKLTMLAPEKSDPAAQADLVRKNLDRSVSTVCVQSTGQDVTAQLTRDLMLHGTPVVLIGQDIPTSGRFGHVGWDEFEAGKALATALKASLGDRTTFMVLYAEGAGEVYASRLSGFSVGMQDYTFLRELNRFDCQADRTQALKILAEQGRRYPQLGAWACMGDWPARVRIEDLQQSLPAGTTLAIVGALPDVWPLLERSICGAAVGTDYGRWGYEAVSLSELGFHRAVKPGEVRHTPPRIIYANEINGFKDEWAAWAHGRITTSRPTSVPQAISIPQ
jgi:ABC-type sugar transport system substrate-binding protein